MPLSSTTLTFEESVLLTRHPQPYSWRESLRGYALRLTEGNGYKSPWNVYARAGLMQYEVRGAGFNVEKLALICNCSPLCLQTIAYKDPARAHVHSLLGESVSAIDSILNPLESVPNASIDLDTFRVVGI